MDDLVNQTNAILIDLSGEKLEVKRDAIISVCVAALKNCKCNEAKNVIKVFDLLKTLYEC
ncbi:MAG: hypothetical protein GQ527_01655 [Bacteroidales bacterium]|nr:hypothetical protein [Bacteroidales bacterium]